MIETPDLSGMQFEVTYTSCDAISHWDEVTVYVSKSASRESWLEKSLDLKTPIFTYDPWNWDSPPPSIKALGDRRVQISVPKLTYVYFRAKKWNDVYINYDIRYVQYP